MNFIFLFLLGAAVGSFINVVVDRAQTGESPFEGRSHCDHCDHTLSWWELVPIVSFLILQGKCGACGQRLGWQYPVVELVTGALFVLASVRFLPDSPESLLSLFFVLVIILVFWVIFLMDLKYYLVPDRLVLAGVAAALLARGIGEIRGAGVDWGGDLISGLGAALFFLLLVALTRGRGMGGGDVKLAFLIGLVLGWPATLISLYLAFLAGGLAAALLLLAGKRRFGQMIPFAPFLTSSAIFALLYENWILELARKLIGLW